MKKMTFDIETGESVLEDMTQEEIDALQPHDTIQSINVVTMRQARLALLQQGLLSQVQSAIDALPSPQKEAAQIEWDYSSEVHRDKAFVQTLAAALGLSEQQLDDLFLLASTL
jgi:hypothetical protein